MKRIALAIAAVLVVPAAYAVNCSWNTVPTNINFGAYSVFGPAVTATSTFQIQCTPPATGNVTLTKGSSTTYTPRTMTKAGGSLGYNLYRDAANTAIWGDGTSGTQYLSFTPVPGNTTLTTTIYGTIPANLDSPPGTYTDTVQATLNWGSGSSSQFFTITATISAECNVSTSALNFGNYDPVSANATTPLDATTAVNVYCTAQTPVTVALNNGLWVTGSTRRLKSAAGNFLTYDMYKDAARTTVWNATNLNSGTSTSKLTPINNGFTVYGRLMAGQDIPAGSYSDTVTVTVNY
jgi:spore coat protein U domain-containing protein, fimbrial subunit CupE1/2/3/6